ncbi:hypothetical protein BUALT_Bualt05G0023000 [Buddleja alternifolia]|uniref:Uncharacterized protein n=1 Tax=Buddleja alternifolia TaxID=168488 RepID=A0AAV6XG12_9LAMI|nr:hypothetical protein BUALT_Bualt05G0023000 [Buddleja alternifolia]
MKQAFDWKRRPYRSVTLDISSTELDDIPDEIGHLTRLKHIKLSFYGPDSVREYHSLSPQLISHDIISKLEELQGLSIVIHPQDRRWKEIVEEVTKDVATLKMLSYLEFYFPEVESFQCFIRTSPSWNEHILRKFRFIVGHDVKRIIHPSTRGNNQRLDNNAITLPRLRKLELRWLPRLVSLGNGLYVSEENITTYNCPKLVLDSPPRERKVLKQRKFLGSCCCI